MNEEVQYIARSPEEYSRLKTAFSTQVPTRLDNTQRVKVNKRDKRIFYINFLEDQS